MRANEAIQMDLLGSPTPVAKRHRGQGLVVEVDHRSWMRFLNEEWLYPDETGLTLLGLGRSIVREVPSQLTPVGIWFDQEKLPKLEVMAWRNGSWTPLGLDSVSDSDTAVAWRGPLPLFAVDHFTFETREAKAHMMAMVRHFADIEVPPQPVLIEHVVRSESLPPIPVQSCRIEPPANWDALRGAAEMALLAVPSIGPWLSVLCNLLNRGDATAVCGLVDAPWLRTALWSTEFATNNELPPLWRAIVRQFARPGLLKEWQPKRILHDVCVDANSLGYNDEELRVSTTMLLEDRGTIQTVGLQDDTLALIFQLVLLRPSPARFVSWKDDWPAIPPGAWWGGAMLSGYLSGFRALPLQFRGTANARRHLALQTWRLGTRSEFPRQWGELSPGPVSWATASDAIIIYTEQEYLSELKFSNRGRWNQLDFDDEANLAQATDLAQQFCPDVCRKSITFENGIFQLLGPGRATLDASGTALEIAGKLEIAFDGGLRLTSRLDIERFRRWLVTASIVGRLPRPLGQGEGASVGRTLSSALPPSDAEHPPKRGTAKVMPRRAGSVIAVVPEGLSIVSDFVSEEQEARLLELIDSLPWDTTMTRRVQHYGWRYDYKARKVNPAAYLGPLPDWAASLGQQLFDRGYLAELPDQVIVNEYIGSQSISKHIDCPSCFRGAIVTISLNESWEMLFSRPSPTGGDEKHKVVLTRRSAAVLDGPSRHEWKHEIPRKAKENGIPRRRRVSITLRKVAVSK